MAVSQWSRRPSGATDRLLGWALVADLERPIVLTMVAAVLSNLVPNVPAVPLFNRR
jgi:hypothetical protein